MKNFFGALFLLAAVVFLYKAGVLVPDLASAFGGLRYSYDPAYVPADSMNIAYGAASYNAAYYGNPPQNYYANTAPRYEYARPTVYSGARPIICYSSHMPIVDGVNYNYPVMCNEIPSYGNPGSPYPAPATYPTSYTSRQAAYYPTPAYYGEQYQQPMYQQPVYQQPAYQPPQRTNNQVCYK